MQATSDSQLSCTHATPEARDFFFLNSDSFRCVMLYWIQLEYYIQTQHFNICHPVPHVSVQRAWRYNNITKIVKRISILAMYIVRVLMLLKIL